MSKRKIAIAFISIVGLIHLALSPEYFDEQPYIGVLFVLGAVGCGLVAVMLGRNGRDARAWALGTMISAGMFVGFILSRTVGLPGFHEGEWEISGIVSLILEAGFVGIAASRLSAGARTRRPLYAAER